MTQLRLFPKYEVLSNGSVIYRSCGVIPIGQGCHMIVAGVPALINYKFALLEDAIREIDAFFGGAE